MFTLKRVNATIEDPLRVPRLAQPDTPSARCQFGCLAAVDCRPVAIRV